MTDLRWVAIHEAGHGVARLRLFPDQYFEHISIEEQDDSLGRVILAFDTTVISKSSTIEDGEDLFMSDAICACAGYAACTVAGFSEEQALTGCESDFERAGHRKERACELALELLGRDENVRAVRLIADKLLELSTIDHDHIGVLIELADGECSEDEYREYLELRETG
jgi:ATP-dependent Zn protease